MASAAAPSRMPPNVGSSMNKRNQGATSHAPWAMKFCTPMSRVRSL